MKQVLLSMSLVFLAAACGDDGAAASADGGPPGDAAEADAFVAPPGSFKIEFPEITIPSGTENTQCIVKRLGNPEALRVGRIHNLLGAGSHHFIVYRVADTEEQLTPFNCSPFQDVLDPSQGAPLMITQRHEELLTLPDGVAFTLEANQMIRLEVHYINSADDPLALTASSTFVPIPEAEYQHEADFLFIGNVNINLPPMSSYTTPDTRYPMSETGLGEVTLFGITGHTHQWGTDVYVGLDDGTSETPLYELEDFRWHEPETVYFDPDIQVGDEHTFNFRCEWFNASTSTVGFGESANQEMCFFWTYYYPSQGAKVCFTYDNQIRACCPGGNPIVCDNV